MQHVHLRDLISDKYFAWDWGKSSHSITNFNNISEKEDDKVDCLPLAGNDLMSEI